MRTFVAIELDAPLVRALAEARAHLEAAGAPVRWVAPEKVHVTVKFLGEIPADAAGRAAEILAEHARATEPFDLDVEGVGPFPNPRRPRVVAAKLREIPAPLQRVAAALDGAYAELGVAADGRPFHAHLTLGRIRRPGGLGRLYQAMGDLAGRTFGRLHVDHLTLIESVLGPGGPTYTALARPPLAGSPPGP